MRLFIAHIKYFPGNLWLTVAKRPILCLWGCKLTQLLRVLTINSSRNIKGDILWPSKSTLKSSPAGTQSVPAKCAHTLSNYKGTNWTPDATLPTVSIVPVKCQLDHVTSLRPSNGLFPSIQPSSVPPSLSLPRWLPCSSRLPTTS